MLTQKQIKKYLENPGLCPFCESNTINIMMQGDYDDMEFFDLDGKEVFREVVCAKCEKQWREYFALHEIQELDETGSAIPNKEVT